MREEDSPLEMRLEAIDTRKRAFRLRSSLRLLPEGVDRPWQKLGLPKSRDKHGIIILDYFPQEWPIEISIFEMKLERPEELPTRAFYVEVEACTRRFAEAIGKTLQFHKPR